MQITCFVLTICSNKCFSMVFFSIILESELMKSCLFNLVFPWRLHFVATGQINVYYRVHSVYYRVQSVYYRVHSVYYRVHSIGGSNTIDYSPHYFNLVFFVINLISIIFFLQLLKLFSKPINSWYILVEGNKIQNVIIVQKYFSCY